MFSENQKISGRQMQRLVVLDWVGKASLLLPLFIGKAGGRDFLFSLFLGLAVSFLYIMLISWISRHIQNDFYGYIQTRMGKGTATAACLIYWCYVFVNTVYLARLFAKTAVTFLMPEAGQEVFQVMLVLAGCYGAWRGLESRARTAEVVYRILLIPLVLMLLLAAFSVNPAYLAPGEAKLSMAAIQHGLQVFIAFGGAGVFLFVMPRLSRKSDAGRALKKSMLLIGSGAAGVFLTAIGTFGEAGMRALPWPVITLMSTVEIPGGFLQRWDVIFTGLLLCTFFIAATTGFFYLKVLTEELFQKKPANYWIPLMGAAVLLASLWCENYETAASIYVVLNGYVLVPLAAAFTCMLGLIEWKKKRRSR